MYDLPRNNTGGGIKMDVSEFSPPGPNNSPRLPTYCPSQSIQWNGRGGGGGKEFYFPNLLPKLLRKKTLLLGTIKGAVFRDFRAQASFHHSVSSSLIVHKQNWYVCHITFDSPVSHIWANITLKLAFRDCNVILKYKEESVPMFLKTQGVLEMQK